MRAKPAVFLDRDGVINASPGSGYVRRWEEFRFLPGSREGIRALTDAGWPIFVVTNQSGIAQGFYTAQDFDAITARMLEAIQAAGGRITGIFHCPHAPTSDCACRKPRRGLIDQACRQQPVALAESFLVGDDVKDLELGRTIGCRTVLVLSGRTSRERAAELPPPDHLCADLREAADWIIGQRRSAA